MTAASSASASCRREVTISAPVSFAWTLWALLRQLRPSTVRPNPQVPVAGGGRQQLSEKENRSDLVFQHPLPAVVGANRLPDNQDGRVGERFYLGNMRQSIITEIVSPTSQVGEFVILRPMATRPASFWKEIWEVDLRAPVRDFINQVFFLVLMVGSDSIAHVALSHSQLDQWLQDMIFLVFNGLSVIALATLAFPMGLRMIRSGLKRAKGSHDET